MHGPKPEEFCILKARYHPEDPFLLGVGELRLEADEIPGRSSEVLPAKLNHCEGPFACSGILKTDGFHAAEGQ